MKNLTKIFTAVVAGMFAFSCVTDTTEDLGIQIEGGGKTTTEVVISMEAARTHLGEKADGVYPLYWSEGDAIAINGVASNPLAEVGESASAMFSFEEAVSYPLCTVYPAPAVAAVEEAAEPTTVYPVEFLATQPYTAGSFAPKAAPMYGYGVAPAADAEAEPIAMQHLSGVLRFAVVGNGETVSTLTVKSLSSKLSGAFTVDCTSGALVADESAANTVTVTFPEGTVLGEEPLVVYVAVPAGKHGEIWATLRTTEDKMTVKFNSDIKPLVAGHVREFKQFTYQANEGDTDASVFEIETKEDLIEFARIASVFAPRTTAKVVGNIDMNGYDWKPIEGFGEYIFDGGKEDGFSINGLNAPLFGTTAATIQNLNLTGVAITITDRTQAGAVACNLTGAAMTNVSASGTMVVNNTTFTTTASMSNYNVINYGGLVGIAGGVAFENCESRVNITITSVAEAEQTSVYVAVGGAVGAAHSKSSFTNVDNHGTVAINSTVSATYSAAGILGRIVGVGSATPEVTTVKNCDNHGEIYTGEDAQCGGLILGGILNNTVSDMTISDNTNNGAIHNSGYAGRIYLAGIVGSVNNSKVERCTNNAPIYNEGRTSSLQLGGIVGSDVGAGIVGCTNNTEATLSNSSTTNTGNIYIGGIAAGDNPVSGVDPEDDAISGCYNKAAINHTGVGKAVFIGGIYARNNGVNISDCHNEGAIQHIGTTYNNANENCYISGINGYGAVGISECSNSGNITVGGESAITSSNFRVTGIAHSVSENISGCENSGSITVKNITPSNAIMIAGITNLSYKLMSECNNSGAITIGDEDATTLATLKGVYVAGIANADISSKKSGRITDCENSASADISLYNIDCGSVTYIAGITTVAYRSANDSAANKWQNNNNYGDITTKNLYSQGNAYIAGLAATLSQNGSSETNVTEWYNCNNHGNITSTNHKMSTYDGDSKTDGTQYKARRLHIAGCFANIGSYFNLNNCQNRGEVKMEDYKTITQAYVGGVVGYAGIGSTSLDFKIENCSNSGAVSATTDSKPSETTQITVSGGEGVILGGVLAGTYMAKTGEQKFTISGATNTGALSLGGKYFADHARHCLGGICGDFYGHGTFLNCHNEGAITIQAATKATVIKDLRVGGIAGCSYAVTKGRVSDITFNGCTNFGNIKGTQFKTTNYTLFGGILGFMKNQNEPVYTMNNCGNKGSIEADNVEATNVFRIGGLVSLVEPTSYVTISGTNKNIGSLTIQNSTMVTTKTYVGGIAGQSKVPITGAQAYCNIYATGYTLVGWIMGNARDNATLASGCGIGGMVVTGINEEPIVDAGGNVSGVTTTYDGTAIDASNYLSKVYGGTTPAASDAEASLLTEAPTVTKPTAPAN